MVVVLSAGPCGLTHGVPDDQMFEIEEVVQAVRWRKK